MALPMDTADARRMFSRFWQQLDKNHERVDTAVEDAARQVPAFRSIFERIDPETRKAEQARARVLQRAALTDGDWGPYLADLRARGAAYAKMGVAFEQWFQLLGAYRRAVFSDVLPPGETRDALAGMDQFVDVTMSTIGGAYVDAQEALIRQAESQLELYIDLFRNAPVGMVLYHWDDPPDPGSFRLVAANPACTVLGNPRTHEMVGATLREAVPAILDTETPGHYAQCLTERQPHRWTAERRFNDVRRLFDIRCFPLGDRDLGVIFEDITARKRMRDQLERYVCELERSNRDLDEFAYVASHDLKAPLHDIQNLASWIKEDLGDSLPAASARHVNLLVDRVRRMQGLLEDLLAYSRASRSGASAEPIDLRAVVADVLALLAPPPSFEIMVTSDGAPAGVAGDDGALPTLHTPRAPLAQVLRNLIGNAIKHHDRGGGRIEIAVRDEGPRVRITVKDDGPGVPAQFHQRVFRMFQTLRPRDQVEGSGMGLAIVKRVVEAHGGMVQIASEGRGTAISLTWPRRWTGEEVA